MQTVLVLGTIKSVSNSNYCTGGGPGNIYTIQKFSDLSFNPSGDIFCPLKGESCRPLCGEGGVGNLIHVCCEIGFSTKCLVLGDRVGASELLLRASLLVTEMAFPDRTIAAL